MIVAAKSSKIPTNGWFRFGVRIIEYKSNQMKYESQFRFVLPKLLFMREMRRRLDVTANEFIAKILLFQKEDELRR